MTPPRRSRALSTDSLRAAAVDDAFALCLTHDVDRPYKTYQGLYYGLRQRSLSQLASLRPSVNPYWQFETVMTLEAGLDVRSAFYFLVEPSLFAYGPGAWIRPSNWVEHLGRYDVAAPEIREVIRTLDAGGWEVGLHASRKSAADRDRLATEKRTLESVLGHEVQGCRHHHLQLDEYTWSHHRSVGLRYDGSLGHPDRVGFHHGYGLRRPYDDFWVFPLTAMEAALPDPAESPTAARAAVDRLVRTAADNSAVMTVLWHPRYFSEQEFPGYRDLYRYLIRRALDAGAWVGPPRDWLWRRLAERGGTASNPAGRPP